MENKNIKEKPEDLNYDVELPPNFEDDQETIKNENQEQQDGPQNQQEELYDPDLIDKILNYNKKQQFLKENQAKILQEDQMKKSKQTQQKFQIPKYKINQKPAEPEIEIDMKEIDQLFKLCHQLPKIELHAHLGGCFRPQTFLDLAIQKNIDIDHIDFYNLNIHMAFEIFKVGSQLITDCECLKRVTREIIEDYSKQNCKYLEIRSTPKTIGSITSKEQYVEQILDTIQQVEKELNGIKCAYLISINRIGTVEQAKEAIDLAIQLRNKSLNQEVPDQEKEKYKRLVGIELSGDPRGGDFNIFEPEFERARQNGLKISLHCAETEEQRLESQQMINFKPDRLGHCCYLSKEQIKQVNELNIPVEICPTSNVASVQCGLALFLPHMKEFHSLNHNIVICCDDTLLFNTTLSLELFEYAKTLKIFDRALLKNHLIKNLDAVFLEDEKFKQDLIYELESKF